MKMLLCNHLLLIFLLCSWRPSSALPSNIRIGGIFGPEDQYQELAFQYAVEGINKDQGILARSTLRAQIEHPGEDDSFQASKKVCRLLQSGVAGIFGPQSESTANHVQSICDAMEIPHIETRWDYKTTKDYYSINLYPHPMSLGQAYYDIIKRLRWKNFVVLYDRNFGLVRLQSLLKVKEWTVTIRQLNEGNDWRPMLKEIKKSQATKFVIDVSDSILYELMKQAYQIGLMTDYHSYFITSLDMHLINIEDFRYGGTNITSLRLFDPEKPDVKKVVEEWRLGELRFWGTRPIPEYITTEAALMYDAVHLFARALDDLDRSREVAIPALYCEADKTWKHGNSLVNYMKWYGSPPISETSLSNNMRYPNAHSASRNGDLLGIPEVSGIGVHGMARLGDRDRTMNLLKHHDYSYLRYTDRNTLQPYLEEPPLNRSGTSSRFGEVQVYGLTGLIKFDREGFRSDVELEITELDSKAGMKKVGTWTREGKANYTRSLLEASATVARNLQNRTLIVTTALTAPYTMLKETSDQLTGNDRFEGFCIDIVREVAKILEFNYTLELIADGAYGSLDENNEWNGMIRELLDHKADLAIVDFTITYQREEAVDFSMPFMNLGIGIIYKKPQKSSPSLFSFMSPFSIDVWIYMATAYLGVSVLLFILARMSPSEWDSPYPCIQEPEELENNFTLQNSMWFIIGTFLCQGADIAPRITPNEWDNPHPCIQDPDELENAITLSNAFWFTIGSLMQQGSDIAPKAVSTRIVAGIWWFFTLIMISSYTANLAAFLTVERMESPIEGAEDLAKQTKIKYGCKLNGATYSFFSQSTIPTYQRMWAAMSSSRPTVFTPTNEDGVERVSNSDGMYAFLMESSSIEYEVERRCDLMQVGGLLDSKSYGIALPPDSPYTGQISSAILKLKESGAIHEMKTKWWKRRKGGGRCVSEDKNSASGKAAELGLPNVGGVFVVLIGGMGISAITAVCEFFWNARELATDENKDKPKDAASAAELGLDNVGGVFVVMAGGGAMACFLACCEFTWKARKLAAQEGDSFLDELWLELKFIAKCNENEKPVKKPKSPETDSTTFYSSSNNYGYAKK